MNIDERIEALVQSVELLYLNSRDSDRRMDEVWQRMEERDRLEAEQRAEFRLQMAELNRQMAEYTATSDRLWKLYTSHDRNLALHEQRLDEHDNRLHSLDGGLSG
jgi:hypothetical protein